MDFDNVIKKYSGQPLTRQIMLDVLKDYSRPYDKINELVKKDLLTPIKRGVYISGPLSMIPPPERLSLAMHLLGPSYVSSDTALAYWGLIPERVYETISMTTKQGKVFTTAAGRFRYLRLPLPYYVYGIKRVEIANQQIILMAGREKALCDKIITTDRLKLRSVRQTKDYLLEDLRMSRDSLLTFDTLLMEDYLNKAPKKESLLMLIKTLHDL